MVCSSQHAIDRSRDESPRVEQVLRAELLHRPPGAGFKLNPKEVPNLPVRAITNAALEFAFRITDAYARVDRYGRVNLHAGAGQRNVFEICHRPADSTIFVFPLDVDQICA